MKQWYEELFTNFAESYEHLPFTQGTLGECDFIESEINSDKGFRILDIGCGTGRHAIELARRGYKVTGIDLSECQLNKARTKAAHAGLNIDFIQADARKLTFSGEFDLAIMLCEGGFSLMETDQMNYAILQGATKSLRPGGKFIFTCLNGLFPLFHSVKDFMEKNNANAQQDGGTKTDYNLLKFDLMTFREDTIVKFTDDSGEERELSCNERYYVPSEITWQLQSLGMNQIEIFGAELGAYSRRKLSSEDFEMLVISRKQ